MKHKRCPNCNSRKWYEYRGRGRCGRCGFRWEDPSLHKTIFTKDLHIGDEKPQNSTSNDEKNSKDILTIDMHNNVYKFKILKDNPDVSIGTIKHMKNWNIEILHKGEITYRRTTKNILISIERRFLEDIKNLKDITDADDKIKELFVKAAYEFQKEFGILLDLKHPTPIMKEVKSIEGFTSPVQFNGKKIKCVYPDGSIEWVGRDAVETFKNFLENLSMESKADQMLIKMDGGFNTLAYLLTQQNDILKMIIPEKENSFLKTLKNLLNISIKIKNEIL